MTYHIFGFERMDTGRLEVVLEVDHRAMTGAAM